MANKIMHHMIHGDDTYEIVDKKLRESFVTPEMFGAKGDGVTDDTDAINAAFQGAANKEVLFPEGKVYAFSGKAPIAVPSNLTVRLDGTIKCTAARDTSLEFFDRVTETPGFTGVHDVLIYGKGTFDCQGDTLSGAYATPFRIHHCKDIVIRGITIKNYSKYHAIEIGGSYNVLIDNVKFKGMFVNSNASGTFEAVQIEPISEVGTGGAIPYDGTITKNVTIRNCYFGPSDEGGAMYSAIGTHTGFDDSTKANMFEGLRIEKCTFSDFSWNPNKQKTSAPVYGAGFAVVGLDTNHRNTEITDCLFDNVGNGIAIHIGNYSDHVRISGNQINNTYGTALSFQKCEYLSLENNTIDNFALYNTDMSSSVNMCIGIYFSESLKGLRVCGNKIISSSNNATLPIHIPGVGPDTDIGDAVFSGNIIDVLGQITSGTKDTTISNINRYNRDTAKRLYNGSLYTGNIELGVDARIYRELEIIYTVGESTSLNSKFISIYDIWMINTARSTVVSEDRVYVDTDNNTNYMKHYEMPISFSSNYTSMTINSNKVATNDGSAISIDEYTSGNTDFICVKSIFGYTGNNAIV